MKVISLNTWAGVVLDPLLDFFRKYHDVDIFCLQEIYKDAEGKEDPHPTLPMTLDIFEQIENVLKDTHIGFFKPAHEDFYGLAIFIKKDLPIFEEGDVQIFVAGKIEGRGRHNRNLQYIVTEFHNEKVCIANLHGLWNGQGKTDTQERINQSENIKKFLNSRSEKVVLVGDFNLNPDTKSLAIVSENMVDLIKMNDITSTRTSLYEKENKFADYAFVSKDLEVKDFKVLADEVSDHAALFLEI